MDPGQCRRPKGHGPQTTASAPASAGHGAVHRPQALGTAGHWAMARRPVHGLRSVWTLRTAARTPWTPGPGGPSSPRPRGSRLSSPLRSVSAAPRVPCPQPRPRSQNLIEFFKRRFHKRGFRASNPASGRRTPPRGPLCTPRTARDLRGRGRRSVETPRGIESAGGLPVPGRKASATSRGLRPVRPRPHGRLTRPQLLMYGPKKL